MGEPSFRQLAAAPELISASARVTTTTTLTASNPVDDACSEERGDPNEAEANMRTLRLLPAPEFVKPIFARNGPSNF